ncbi:di-heme enzyme [Aliiglaciecola sp. CAU 1673]|uniref:methanobactin export MATE transporter MbnM n=1 Tax=Aliiglaciecola sp. CAU 1673 TaxID=3032595 RepID=UPI0023DADE23|nr:methanobactin export MATE transporter MbnM [Aliiglaciecola sp. CAU 1673]MDF2177437.1 di-heme enzyme [Aliiglaciecola sp. CAU 1673]
MAACTKAPEPYQWQLPEGFPAPLVPEDNPMSQAKVTLGRHLFYDRNLSANASQSCADCHQQQYAFAEPKVTAIGSTGEAHRRNSQSLVNVAYNGSFTWAHSGLSHIEQQLLIPLFGEKPVEMGISGHENEVLARLDTPQYHALFKEAFPGEEVSFSLVVKALASFVRSLLSFDSPFDHYAYGGDDSALSDSAQQGLALFFSEQLECHHCHGGFNFTQSSKHERQQLDLRPFHNTGLYNEDGQGAFPIADQGLIEISQQSRDMGHFRAPSLRNVAVSAPYMHDGSLATLEEVIDFYAAGGRGNGINSPLKSPFVKGFEITDAQKQDLLAFLHSLTDPAFLNNPRHGPPKP